jgi:predicted naringenin-chalcone synthase
MEKKDKQIKNISQNNNISGSGNNLIQNTETMNNYGITPDILTTILTVSIPEVIKNFEHNNMSSIVNGAKAELTDSKYDTSSVNLD